MSIYAVNGKEPVSAWIPSLDTSGNGTTTLTDLVGSNDGTLTNMDAGSDWPADTDAGGVRALDADGVNDQVLLDSSFTLAANSGMSIWIKPAQYSAVFCGESTSEYIGVLSSTRVRVRTGAVNIDFNLASGSIPLDTWHHIVIARASGSTTVWLNNSTIDTITTDSPVVDQFFSRLNNLFLAARMDDVRVFSVSLDSSDIAYLYNSGTGRGIVASSGAPAQNAQHNNLRNIRMAP